MVLEVLHTNVDTLAYTAHALTREAGADSNRIEGYAGLGKTVVDDCFGVDFDLLGQELTAINVQDVLLEEFTKTFEFVHDESKPQITIQEVIRKVEFFMAQPEIMQAMDRLNVLAQMFAHMCGGADGHGGFSISGLGGNAKTLYEQGAHSSNDGHGHSKSDTQKEALVKHHETGCESHEGKKCSCSKGSK